MPWTEQNTATPTWAEQQVPATYQAAGIFDPAIFDPDIFDAAEGKPGWLTVQPTKSIWTEQ